MFFRKIFFLETFLKELFKYLSLSLSLSLSLYIYIYIYIERERERESDTITTISQVPKLINQPIQEFTII